MKNSHNNIFNEVPTVLFIFAGFDAADQFARALIFVFDCALAGVCLHNLSFL